jgi:uroporphyrinogen-III synthase
VQDGSVWLLSSSEAAANLNALMPGLPLQNACAVATHPRIAHAARVAGFKVVTESRPMLDAVARSIKLLT